jgi:hypothetical protein
LFGLLLEGRGSGERWAGVRQSVTTRIPRKGERAAWTSPTLTMPIAAVAHRCWCKRMLEEGWRAGKIFDAEAKEHDAI